MLLFTLVSPPWSLSLRPMTKESFDALRTIYLVFSESESSEPEHCLRCFLGDDVGVLFESRSDEMSIDGR